MHKILDDLKNNKITVLDLSGKCFEINTLIKLCNILKYNTSLISLNLSYNEINEEKVKLVTDALKENTTLTKLSLAANHITYGGTKYINDMLKHNATLTSINLSYNKFGIKGLICILNDLKLNTSLNNIDLLENRTSILKVDKVLVEIFETNKSIIWITPEICSHHVIQLCMRNEHNVRLRNMSLLQFANKIAKSKYC